MSREASDGSYGVGIGKWVGAFDPATHPDDRTKTISSDGRTDAAADQNKASMDLRSTFIRFGSLVADVG